MNMQNKRILEALQIQPLSQEEMTSRHILGRLYGPIATCVESTRNGRLYNRPLWEKALVDEIFLEKVATKALFLELGHPADREETDMKQACACIPEIPKIVGDDLCAYVDILDTPNGRLLKTLVDYGFVPGISSRGSGDVMDDNQVDPETFFLETWDIVQLPAVKKARLNVYESLDSNNIKLKKALAESYKAAKEEDKDTMKKALENLNIDINNEISESEEVKVEEEPTKKVLTAEDIPWDPDAEQEEVLVEDAEETTEDSEVESEIEADEDDIIDTENVEEQDTTEDQAEDDTETTADDDFDYGEEISKEEMIETVKEIIDEYGEEVDLDFRPIEIEGDEHVVTEYTVTADENTITIGVSCEEPEEDSDDAGTYIATENDDEEISDGESEETEDDSDSADDDGDVEVIESLKDMIRQKEALETELSELRKAKTVGDAKEQELQEKLTRYREAFKKTSAEAAKVLELQSKVKELSEQLTQSKNTIKTLTEKVNNAQQLKESADVNKIRLTEQVNKLTQKSEALEAKLEGQTKQYTKKLQERTDLAKAYKARFIETLNKYVESKASMLSVQPSEITSRLNENYTLADVDAVCDQILDSTINFGRLPFSGRGKTSVRIAESVSKNTVANTRINPDYGYDIDDSLLELAGLKK